MSSHWKFVVHVTTPGNDSDIEKEVVERFAQRVEELAASMWLPPHDKPGVAVTVTGIERN